MHLMLIILTSGLTFIQGHTDLNRDLFDYFREGHTHTHTVTDLCLVYLQIKELACSVKACFTWPWLWKHVYGLTILFVVAVIIFSYWCFFNTQLMSGTTSYLSPNCCSNFVAWWVLYFTCNSMHTQLLIGTATKTCVHVKHPKSICDQIDLEASVIVTQKYPSEDRVRLPTWRGNRKLSRTQSSHPILHLYMYRCGCT